jgi:hypothetical protein
MRVASRIETHPDALGARRKPERGDHRHDRKVILRLVHRPSP